MLHSQEPTEKEVYKVLEHRSKLLKVRNLLFTEYDRLMQNHNITDENIKQLSTFGFHKFGLPRFSTTVAYFLFLIEIKGNSEKFYDIIHFLDEHLFVSYSPESYDVEIDGNTFSTTDWGVRWIIAYRVAKSYFMVKLERLEYDD